MFEDLVLSSQSEDLIFECFDACLEVINLHLMVGLHFIQYFEADSIAIDQRHYLVLQFAVLLLVLFQLRLQALKDKQVSALYALPLHLFLLDLPF